MVSLVEVGEYDIDEEALQVAVESYTDFRSSGEYQGNETQESVNELNEWIEKEGLGKGRVVSYLKKLDKAATNSPFHSPKEDIESLETEAQEDPVSLADDLNKLYDGDGSLADRVEDFRRSRDIEPVTVSILLTTYDPDEYVLYTEEDFRVFVSYFTGINGPNLDEMLVGERYELFREYCSVIRTQSLEGRLDGATLFDGQDFVSTVVQHPECRYNFVLKYLFRYSQRMQRFEEDTGEHLEAIRELPAPFLRDQLDKYEGRSKIGKIRYEILDAVLDDVEVDFWEIAEDENKRYEDKNIMQSWDEFKVLAQIYYNYSKSRVNYYLQDLSDYLISEIGGDKLSSNIVGYQGSASFPITNSWIVIYPSIFDDHKSAYQIFLDVRPNKVRYGLSNGSELSSRKEFEHIENEDEISLQKIVREYKKKEKKFWSWNEELIEGPETEEYDEMEWFNDVANHLRRKGQVIFHGAPGTGKTYGALNFSKWWIDRELDEEKSYKKLLRTGSER